MSSSPMPWWERPSVFVLLLVTAVLYTWGLDINGWANSYYSAAAMAGAQDWTAFFYGSSDSGNAITVDKPPLSLWVMSISVRLFGLNSWSLLVPQALMGILTVWLLYKTVRARFGTTTGLLAATFMAVTPVSTVMFRYNNPDALLTLLMVAIAYSLLQAIDRQRGLWLVWGGALVGAGFLTKQLQIGLVLPAFIVTYLVFARNGWPAKLGNLLMSGIGAIVIAGSWLLAVQLSDPSSRPFIGGSRNNNALELALGYNGLDRLTGTDASRTMTGSAAALAEKFDPGFQRFLQPQFSGQFGWFIPFALVGLFVAIWYLRNRPTMVAKHALLVFSAIWFGTSTTVLAYMSGIVHPYYSLTAAPPLSAMAAIGLVFLARRLRRARFRIMMSLTMLAYLLFTSITAFSSTADFSFLPSVIAGAGGLTIALLLVPPPNRLLSRITVCSLVGTILLSPALWSINTVASPHVGTGVIGGPSIRGIRGDSPDLKNRYPDLPDSFTAVMFGDVAPLGVVRHIQATSGSITWAAATVGSESAANLQLESGRGILPLGGFDGTDPYPTLEKFQQLVQDQRVGALTLQNLPPLVLEGKGEAARIVDWVRSHFEAEYVDGAELYVLRPQ